MKKSVYLLSLILTIWACSKSSDDVVPTKNTEEPQDSIPVDTVIVDTAVVPFDCHDSTFLFHQAKGVVNWIDEASGLAFSTKKPTSLWTHEDSNNQNKLYLFSSVDGSYQGSLLIDGANNKDWEDLSISVGPEDGKHYFYIADFGDNKAKRTYKQIYRIEEPDVSSFSIPFDQTISGADEIEYIYEDGKRDAECLLVDPLTKDIYIISKREAKSMVYKLSYPQSTSSVNTAINIHTLDFREVTAGDVSLDGNTVVVKTYEKLYLWKRQANETFEEMIKREPFCLPYEPEAQGEAIAFDPTASFMYTLSEKSDGVTPSLMEYTKQ